MRNHDRPRPDTTTTDRSIRRSLGTDHPSVRRRQAELISEAVVASYIHDISERRHEQDPLDEGRAPGVDA